MTTTPRLPWTTPAVQTLSISLDTAFDGGSATDGNTTGNPGNAKQ